MSPKPPSNCWPDSKARTRIEPRDNELTIFQDGGERSLSSTTIFASVTTLRSDGSQQGQIPLGLKDWLGFDDRLGSEEELGDELTLGTRVLGEDEMLGA